MEELDFTRHFLARVRRRVGVNKRAVRAWARSAVERGDEPRAFRGEFRAYLDEIVHDPRHPANRAVVFAPYIVLLRGNRCITLYHVPGRFRRAAYKQRRKRDKG